MLPKIHRLTLKADFENVFRHGSYHTIGSIYLKKIATDKNITRIGIVVEKKNFKLATKRNRIRRLIKEALRQKITEIQPGCDVVLFYRNRGKIVDLATLAPAIAKLLQKSNLIKRIS